MTSKRRRVTLPGVGQEVAADFFADSSGVAADVLNDEDLKRERPPHWG